MTNITHQRAAVVVEAVERAGIVAVIRMKDPNKLQAVVDAIAEGGIRVLEITMTVPGAVDLIRDLAPRLPEGFILGAGTVLDAETAQRCVDAGARFIVSPALDIPTIELCRRIGVPVFPGALTPTEILTAWKAGANAVKVFPANAVGGATYIKSLKAPLPQIELLPTGGVSLKTAGDFIAAGAFALGVGADLVDLAALRRGDAAAITEKARQYVAVVATARAV